MADDKPELREKLQEVANKENALIMSFIAPDSTIRTSPTSIAYARIRVQDLYDIERTIEDYKKEKGSLPKKLHLIIHTPGGDLSASTKIATYLQDKFEEIVAFIPYEAASGGTILCLAASTIVMDSASNLSPIDPQVLYKGQRISVTSYEQAINDFKKKNGNLKPEELSSPLPQMANQFDPIIAREMSRLAADIISVAYRLLSKSQKPTNLAEKLKILDTVFWIGNSETPHTHIIFADEAYRNGLKIDNSNENLTLLMLYKEWVSAKLNENQATHVIKVYSPDAKRIKKQEVKDEQKNEKKATKKTKK
ncbi:MAG: hypothetical protein Q7R51_02370 [bacterium]|nr:hypothetical protein [bacterium]